MKLGINPVLAVVAVEVAAKIPQGQDFSAWHIMEGGFRLDALDGNVSRLSVGLGV